MEAQVFNYRYIIPYNRQQDIGYKSISTLITRHYAFKTWWLLLCCSSIICKLLASSWNALIDLTRCGCNPKGDSNTLKWQARSQWIIDWRPKMYQLTIFQVTKYSVLIPRALNEWKLSQNTEHSSQNQQTLASGSSHPSSIPNTYNRTTHKSLKALFMTAQNLTSIISIYILPTAKTNLDQINTVVDWWKSS